MDGRLVVPPPLPQPIHHFFRAAQCHGPGHISRPFTCRVLGQLVPRGGRWEASFTVQAAPNLGSSERTSGFVPHRTSSLEATQPTSPRVGEGFEHWTPTDGRPGPDEHCMGSGIPTKNIYGPSRVDHPFSRKARFQTVFQDHLGAGIACYLLLSRR